MTTNAVRHADIVLELELPVAPAPAFAAFADPELRRRWVRMPGARDTVRQEFDIRVGATERSTSEFAVDGRIERLDLRTTWLDLVEPSRLVSAVAFRLDDVVRWTSLLTIELEPTPSGGTRLRRTEQLAVLEPSDVEGAGEKDVAHQRGGARLQLNGLVALLTETSSGTAPLAAPRRGTPAG